MAIGDEQDIAERVNLVRSAVADAATGLDGEAYRTLFEHLLSDADGWRMELEETAEPEEDEEDEDEEDAPEESDEWN